MSQQRKSKYEKYLEAAERIDAEESFFSCSAVYQCGLDYRGYAKIFSAEDGCSLWSGQLEDAYHFRAKDIKAHRVMMLLFAAQMARTGDL